MTLTNLQADARWYVFGDSSEETYADADLNRNLNSRYQDAIAIAMSVNGDWQVLGNKAYTDLIAGQNIYSLPTDILKLNNVYVKYGATTEYTKAVKVDPTNINNIDPDEEPYQPYPPRYDLQSDYIYIYTPEDTITGVSNGLRIHYQTELTELSSGSDEPVIPKPLRRYLSLGAAYDYCLANEMGKGEILKRDLLEAEQKMRKWFVDRLPGKITLTTRREQNN